MGAFCVASLALGLCVIQGTVGYPVRKVIALDPGKFRPAGDFGYSAPLPAGYSPKGPQAASVRLREDGKLFSHYSSKDTDATGIGQGILSIPAKGRLTFSTSDNSDPRTNRRSYSADLPLHIPKAVLFGCFAFWVTAAICVSVGLSERKEVASVWIRRLSATGGSILAVAGKWPPLVLSLPSIYFLSSYPPLWKGIDATCQLTSRAEAINILGWPPIYCFLGRIPFAVVTWIAGGSPVSLYQEQEPSLAGVYLLIVFQHIILIASLTYTVISLTQNRLLRGLLALSLASMSGVFAYAQSCGSEALSAPAMFVVLAAGLSIMRGSKPTAWIAYGIALFFAIGIRHINVVFVIWLPMTLGFLGFAARIGWLSPQAKAFPWQALVAAASIGIAAMSVNVLLARAMIVSVHDEYRSAIGRTIRFRLEPFFAKMPVTARLQLAHDLQTNASNSAVAVAIESLATAGSNYGAVDRAIFDELGRLQVPAAKVQAEYDRVLEAGTMRYLMTFHPVLIGVIWTDFAKGLNSGNAKIADTPFYQNLWGAQNEGERRYAETRLRNLPFVELPEATVILDAARRDPYVNLWHGLPLGLLVVIAVFLSGLGWVADRKISGTALMSWSALATGIALFAANCVLVPYEERYALPFLITTVFALLTSVTLLAEAEKGSMISKLGIFHARPNEEHRMR